MGEQINLVINNIADKLGVAVDKLYPTLLTQARIDGVMALVIMGIITIAIIVAIIGGIKVEKYMRKEGEYWGNMDSFFVGFIVVIIVGFAVSLWIGQLQTATTALCNPDYYILQNILNQLY